MRFSCVGKRRVQFAVIVSFVGLAASLATTTEAEARKRGPKRRAHNTHHAAARNVYAPPFSAMVVDANNGRTMYAVSEDELRHPASITKVMTLYLLFEQLERGTLSLDSELTVSRRASLQAPSKLGLRPGETIRVEDAIKAIVTKSANDVAVVIAENVGGSEDEFAALMTRKARQLGMTSTVYRNASGLPNSEQVTTARDLTILARAIQEKFPREYRYFQTRSFNFAGRTIGNHNHLLGRVEGVDGIKTGFTNASGFNLMTNARVDGRHVVGVVLGGRSVASRDKIMTNLIQTNIARASTGGSASVFASLGERRGRSADGDVETTAATLPVGRPLDLNAMRPAVASAQGAASTTTPSAIKLSSAMPLPPSALAYAGPASEAPVPPTMAQKIEARLPATQAAPARVETASARVETAKAEPRREAVRASQVTPWVIQLAAEGNEGKAFDILDQAKSRAGRVLSKAAPFTEKVVRGNTTLYRARFSGFTEADSAQEACKALKRSGFACFATRS